jgi:hypothetical protein
MILGSYFEVSWCEMRCSDSCECQVKNKRDEYVTSATFHMNNRSEEKFDVSNQVVCHGIVIDNRSKSTVNKKDLLGRTSHSATRQRAFRSSTNDTMINREIIVVDFLCILCCSFFFANLMRIFIWQPFPSHPTRLSKPIRGSHSSMTYCQYWSFVLGKKGTFVLIRWKTINTTHYHFVRYWRDRASRLDSILLIAPRSIRNQALVVQACFFFNVYWQHLIRHMWGINRSNRETQ